MEGGCYVCEQPSFIFLEKSNLNESTPKCADDCPRMKWVFRLLVFAQFVLVAILVLSGRSHSHQWYVWLTSLAGVAFGLWAIVTMGRFANISPALKENAPLRTDGPYRFVRHPMYFALLVFCGAYLIESFSIYSVCLWFALLLVLACKIYYEERILRSRFPNYGSYAEKTKRIIPFIF